MPILNPPDVLPDAMRFLVRVVLATKGRLNREEALSLIAPAGLTAALVELGQVPEEVEDEGAGTADGGTAGRVIADASLTALLQLGMVSAEEETMEVHELLQPLWRKVDDVTASSFAQQLGRFVLEERGRTVADDLLRACGLLFAANDPLKPFDGFEKANLSRPFQPHQESVLGADIPQSEWPVGNNERWQSLKRLATYMGWCEPVILGPRSFQLLPNCARALRPTVQAMAPQILPGAQFISQCANALPFLDSGTFAFPVNDDAGSLSGGLSLTLFALEHAKVIKLIEQSDAEAFDLVIGDQPEDRRRFRSVEVLPTGAKKGRDRK